MDLALTKLQVDGYAVFKLTNENQRSLYELSYYKPDYDVPNRGHDSQGRYHTKNMPNVEWANYWTGALDDNRYVHEIRSTVDSVISEALEQPICYRVAVSVVTPANSLVRPHVDTPHRHGPWNSHYRTPLGMQVGIPMHEMSGSAGVTGFLPGSHLRFWNINDCYRGTYTSEFLRGCVQPDLKFGEMMVWDARTLHSQMPNVTTAKRYMLLLNYVEESVVDELMAYEATLSA